MAVDEWSGNFRFAITAIAPGERVELRSTYGSTVVIQLFQTKSGAWTWRWTEDWLGVTTVADPRRSWWNRGMAVSNLAQTALLHRLPALAQDIHTHWRT